MMSNWRRLAIKAVSTQLVSSSAPGHRTTPLRFAASRHRRDASTILDPADLHKDLPGGNCSVLTFDTIACSTSALPAEGDHSWPQWSGARP